MMMHRTKKSRQDESKDQDDEPETPTTPKTPYDMEEKEIDVQEKSAYTLLPYVDQSDVFDKGEGPDTSAMEERDINVVERSTLRCCWCM